MTTPTGKLAWGQAAEYDAVDDRAVIAAVTRNRVGLVWPTVVAAGSGLQVIIRGGWLGVTKCDDLTSAVVGSREDQVVQAAPGPATGSREDVVWCSANPDEGTWELSVMPRAAAAGLTGIPLATITVPAGANLATQMDLLPVDASLERRLVMSAADTYSVPPLTGHRDSSWQAAAGNGLGGYAVDVEPGQWYRVRFTLTSANLIQAESGVLEGRIGVGWRGEGAAPATALLAKTAVISWPRERAPMAVEVEWVYRQPITAPFGVRRVYDGRLWSLNGGLYQYAADAGTGGNRALTVEDLGS
jgi:hypothetical protein